MKIIIINLLNNFSGSPNVISIITKGLVSQGYDLKIITNRSEGFLSDISNVSYRYISYKWFKNSRFLTLLSLLFSQFELFIIILCSKRKNRIYYINTITPVGAIIACKWSRKNYYIHVHENMRQKKPIYLLYRYVYKWCNKKSVFVSKYVSDQALNVRNSVIAYNGLSNDFLEEALCHRSPFSLRKTILMLCSLRAHKGVYEFIELAKLMPHYKFELVVSDKKESVKDFMLINSVPDNLEIFSSQVNVHPFYQRARVVLNLSRPDSWIETFGLTLLEGMTYGIPVIGPRIGGPTEIIDNNINGFLINFNEQKLLIQKIQLLMTNHALYSKMSEAAQLKASMFSSDKMIAIIEEYLKS